METNRLVREKNTISKMLALYCQKVHQPANAPLCEACLQLENYAHQRITHCPFGAKKPTCATCKVHCYKPEQREAIRQVMRFCGPRMLLHHPILTVFHLVDGFRFKPDKKD